MKLKVIAKDKDGRALALNLKKEKKYYMPNIEFEIEEERGKELLAKKHDDNPVVEQVETPKKSKNSNNILEENNQ